MQAPRAILAVLVTAALLVGGGVSTQLATASPLTANTLPQAAAPAYIAVIDAGSSGTRLDLFTAQPGSFAVTRVMKSAPNTAGLSSFAEAPDKAGPDAVAPLLAQLDAYLAKEGVTIAEVPVALRATAGMRALELVNAAAVKAIFASTGATLAASGHPVLANGILPSYQEASLAWVDTNALNGSLHQKVDSLGVVEIGGASAQVAFRSTAKAGPGVTRVKVDGEVIPLVAVSYLGLGVNMARDAMQTAHKGGGFCLPRNASGTDPAVYDLGLVMAVDSVEARYELRRCAQAYADILDKAGVTGAVPPNALRTQPGFDISHFVGLGSVSFVLKDFGISPNEAEEGAALTAGLRSTCRGANAWPRVKAVYGEVGAYATTLCPNASLVRIFVFGERGVGVSGPDFEGAPQFGDRAPSWPAGYATTILHP